MRLGARTTTETNQDEGTEKDAAHDSLGNTLGARLSER
jgi:hypothetical protein